MTHFCSMKGKELGSSLSLASQELGAANCVCSKYLQSIWKLKGPAWRNYRSNLPSIKNWLWIHLEYKFGRRQSHRQHEKHVSDNGLGERWPFTCSIQQSEKRHREGCCCSETTVSQSKVWRQTDLTAAGREERWEQPRRSLFLRL